MEPPFFFFDGGEVDDALLGFLDLPPLDTIFQRDVDSSMLSSSPANGEENGAEGLHCSFFPSHDPIHENGEANGQGNGFIPSTEPIPQQAPPFQQQSSFFYPPIEQPTTTAAATGGGGENCCMSRQSEAARKRRKRISEKTLELGSLIPGGNTMNTAQMLQAAFKYVKFLQTQVAILRLMATSPECKDLQILLASPSIQQRLSEEGICVVPAEMADGT